MNEGKKRTFAGVFHNQVTIAAVLKSTNELCSFTISNFFEKEKKK